MHCPVLAKAPPQDLSLQGWFRERGTTGRQGPAQQLSKGARNRGEDHESTAAAAASKGQQHERDHHRKAGARAARPGPPKLPKDVESDGEGHSSRYVLEQFKLTSTQR